jgi:hypothetical protein
MWVKQIDINGSGAFAPGTAKPLWSLMPKFYKRNIEKSRKNSKNLEFYLSLTLEPGGVKT